jgi:S-DNA-T family DNA segregation ATPase FtsK/SpoIIIE
MTVLIAGTVPAAVHSGHEVSWWPLVMVAVLLVAAMALVRTAERLRTRRPDLWWLLFGAPVAVVRVVRTWRVLCEGVDLVMPVRRASRFGVVGRGGRSGGVIVRGQPVRVIVPRRVGLRITRTGLVATVRMLPSQVPGDFEAAVESMAHAWRVHQVSVVQVRPGTLRLVATGYDPLRYPGRGRAAPVLRWARSAVRTGTAPETRPSAGADRDVITPEVLRVHVGVREDGEPWAVDLVARPHHLVVGATRSGKSTLTVALVAALASRPVALVGIDAKGGVELGPLGARLSALATTRGEAADVLEGLVDEVLDRMGRCRAVGVRSVWDLPGPDRVPPVVVVVDEVAELFLHSDRAGKDEASRCVNALVRIAQLGAAAAVHLWIAGQRFGSDLGPGATLLRAQLAGRICHRVSDPETAAMTLAGLSPATLEAALRIPADLPGVAVIGDDSGTWTRVRSELVTVDQAAAVTQRHAYRRVTIPALTGRGEVID